MCCIKDTQNDKFSIFDSILNIILDSIFDVWSTNPPVHVKLSLSKNEKKANCCMPLEILNRLCVWFGLYVARHQILNFAVLESLSATRTTAFLALILTVVTKLFPDYFYVILFLCIGIFLFASRDKKNIG